MTETAPSTIAEAADQLRSKRLSPVELTRSTLQRIESLNPSLNAFITVTTDRALEQARTAEREILRGDWRGPLHGIPIGVKDLIDTAGVRTTAASALYGDRIPTRNAEVVRRLEEAGAILVGKQNLHEFAYGGSSMISAYGEVRNPWDETRIAGGSSGGSTAAVGAGLGFGAIGTDTAGSIREPAALCGAVGFKPSYGRISVDGVIPLSESLDHVGPIARNVADCTILFVALAAADRVPTQDFLVASDLTSLRVRVGVPRQFFYDDLDPEIAAAVEKVLEMLRAKAQEVREIQLTPDNDRTVQAAEAYAFHAASVAKSPELYQRETLRRIKTGEAITRAEYERRLAELRMARAAIEDVFRSVDVVVTPTTPIPAPAIAELRQNPELLRPRELLLLRNTRPFNVWGLPAISIPCGFTGDGLPIGVQIAGPPRRDDLLLQFAHACEVELSQSNPPRSKSR